MSSFSSMLSDSALLILSAILDIPEEPHTVGIEFTVKRHKGLVIGFDFTGFVRLAEQKEDLLTRIPKKHVKKP